MTRHAKRNYYEKTLQKNKKRGSRYFQVSTLSTKFISSNTSSRNPSCFYAKKKQSNMSVPESSNERDETAKVELNLDKPE